ncbi:MAG: hypothetical protein Ta2A_22450 [Treponemataceae bacterium]|nr:MAG: hypothetical protein Ta2A_22450 [Treponemataceae bacterium]
MRPRVCLRKLCSGMWRRVRAPLAGCGWRGGSAWLDALLRSRPVFRTSGYRRKNSGISTQNQQTPPCMRRVLHTQFRSTCKPLPLSA